MAFKVYTISYDYDYDTEEESSCYAVQNGSFPDLELAIAVATTMAEHLALPRNVGRRGRVVGRVVESATTTNTTGPVWIIWKIKIRQGVAD